MNRDERYMKRCLELARKGAGRVAPNPMVGAVVVHEGRVIGSGYHRQYGGPHAEVHAIRSVQDTALLSESTIYVNLEPCSHHGKTPPCADLIIESGIRRVVIGQEDPNPLVAGNGIKKLEAAGIKVTSGILEEECRYLNRRFQTFHSLHRPYVVLKWAQSLDGFMDLERGAAAASGIHWISHPRTKKLVHKWRAEEAAILIGSRTLHNDNPSLTVRLCAGKHPHRVVLTARCSVSTEANIFNDGLPVELVMESGATPPHGLEVKDAVRLTASSADDPSLLHTALRSLHVQGFNSVLVEGGAETLKGFIEAGLWDEARVITAPIHLVKGLAAPRIAAAPAQSSRYGTDHITLFYRQ